MKQSKGSFYTNDPNEIFRRVKDLQIHQQKLSQIKRSQTPHSIQRISLSRHKMEYLEQQKILEIQERNLQLATNIVKISSRPLKPISVIKKLNKSNERAQIKEENRRIFDSNIQLCNRILTQQSNINFKQNLQQFRQHQKIKKRLLRVQHQFEQYTKVTDSEQKRKQMQMQKPGKIRSFSSHHF